MFFSLNLEPDRVSELAIAVGTTVSRIAGFVRNVALAAAIGVSVVADSYHTANNVPTMLFLLLGGGTISAVFMPHLMTAFASGAETFDRYARMLLWLGVAGAVIATLVVGVFFPAYYLLVADRTAVSGQTDLTLALAAFCIPQIFFLAIFAVLSQILNAAGRFSLVAWSPALSSTAIIAASMVLIFRSSLDPHSPASVDRSEIYLLGGATLLGASVQTIALWGCLRSIGVSTIGSLRFRGIGLREVVRAGLLTVTAAACYQASNLIVAFIAARAGSLSQQSGVSGRGYASIYNAQILIYFAQAVVVMSVATVLLRNLARHYAHADGREAASREISHAVLRVLMLVVPMSAILVALGPPTAALLFAYGQTTVQQSESIGLTLSILAAGLVPFALHALLIRPFYAARLARIPLWSAIRVSLLWISGTVAATLLLPASQVVYGIAAAFGLSYAADMPLKLRALRTRLNVQLGDNVKRQAFLLASAWIATTSAGATASYFLPLGPRLLALVLAPSLAMVYLIATWKSSVSPRRAFARASASHHDARAREVEND